MLECVRQLLFIDVVSNTLKSKEIAGFLTKILEQNIFFLNYSSHVSFLLTCHPLPTYELLKDRIKTNLMVVITFNNKFM